MMVRKKITEESIMRDLRGADGQLSQGDLFQIDDGWQRGNTDDPAIRDDKNRRIFLNDFWELKKEKFRKGMEETESDFDREKYQERLAKLCGGVAVIKVGAATETEMKEAKLRMEDALSAAKAAVEEGIVCGGGSAFIHAIKDTKALAASLTGDEKTGAEIIVKALEAPVRQIASNAGKILVLLLTDSLILIQLVYCIIYLVQLLMLQSHWMPYIKIY